MGENSPPVRISGSHGNHPRATETNRPMKNHILKLRCLLAAGATALLLCSLRADDTTTQPKTPPQPPSAGYHDPVPRLKNSDGAVVSRSDRKFLEAAAKSGVKEVAVSEAVLPSLTTPAAQEFARMMVKDHTLANDELKALAANKAVELPPETTDVAKKWTDKNKDDIDEAYLKEMVSDHKAAVDLFEKGTKADDPDVAAFAQKTLPTLRQHLEMAKGNKTAAHTH